MWIDNASSVDMLSYRPYAQLLYKIINNKRMNPLTIGLFGSWGVGKSTLLRLIENEIKENESKDKKIVSITLNAWMFEGYEDAKTALMEDLLKGVEGSEDFPSECGKKLTDLLKRVNYFRLAGSAAKKGIPLALGMMTGTTAPFLLNCTKGALDTLKTEDGIEGLVNIGKRFKENFVKEEEEKNIVENIRGFKKEFEELLKQWGVDNLVVMIDDLDRCTPERIIETLEAIKLFLSVERTTFIIAVDERIVTYAIKNNYPVISEDTTDISKDYIEKIIQIPIKLPELSPIDIQNYMLLLVYELFLGEDLIEILDELYDEGAFFKEELISKETIQSKFNDNMFITPELAELSKVIQQIGGVVARALKGNPRQAKRFLNTFLVRKQMAEICFFKDNKIENDVLAKLMALEYIDLELFKELNRWYKQSNGEIEQIKEMCELVKKDEKLIDSFSKWNDIKIRNWLLCEPIDIYKKNLDRYFYLTRDILMEEMNALDTLNGQEKEFIYQLLEFEDDITSQKKIINKILTLDEQVTNKIVKAIFDLYDKKRIGFNSLVAIFEKSETHRWDILGRLEKMKKEDMKIIMYGYIATLYKIDQEGTKKVLEGLLVRGVITKQALKEQQILI
ncbi:MAG TPA: hypothetical protein GX707_12420 [Epulopiscium sp.]|nr:hypothetical protein [Candidatus Epulonipiscium sp.]